MTIIKVEYDTENPLCSIVKNLRLQAKQEVLDDIEDMLYKIPAEAVNQFQLSYPFDFKEIKKPHLSTFENKRDIIADKSNRQNP